MDSDKNQIQGNQTVSKQTSSSQDNGMMNVRKQDDGKGTDDRLPENYAQVMSMAKHSLKKNRQSAAELERRRTTIWTKLEEAKKILAELRSRLEAVPEFDEDDLAEYRHVLESRVRDLGKKSTRPEAEEDEDQEYEDLVCEDCEPDHSEYDEDGGTALGLETLTESVYEDSCSGSDDISATEETNSNLDINSDEDSDSDLEIKLTKGKGVKVDFVLDDECF